MRECLDEAILQSYFDGELFGHELESVTSHLAACGNCAVTAREIEAESLVLASALAPEFEAAVPTEQLRRRIDAAIAGRQRQSGAVNDSSTFSLRAWLQSLVAPFSIAPQRAFSYAGLVLVLGFAAVLGITQLRNTGTVPTQETVASTSNTTPDSTASVTKQNLSGVAAPSPAGPETVIPVTINPRRNTVKPRNLNSTNAVASRPASNPEDKVKLLPGERSYLQTIAKLDSSINSSNRPMRPSLQAEYQRNLALVDRALAATRDAAKKNPNDPDAAEFMMTAYENKVNLLNAVAEARTFNRPQD